MNEGIETRFGYCWNRPRIALSWVLWLAFFLLAFKENGSLWPFLIPLFCFRRPSGETPNQDRLLLLAFGTLIAVPLVAVVCGSPKIIAFLATPAGMAVIVGLWAVGVAMDFRNYRREPPFRRERTSAV